MSDNPSHWKKGQSGNPKGRPPGKNVMSEILKGVLAQTFMTTEGENPRDITRLEMLINALVRHAELGDKTCLTLLLKELRHIDDRDAVVNSPAEQELQKMKEASESLVRKMHEFRAEEEPGWTPPGTEPVHAPEPGEKTEEDAKTAPKNDIGDAVVRAPGEEARETPQEASESLMRKMREFREEIEAEERAEALAKGEQTTNAKKDKLE